MFEWSTLFEGTWCEKPDGCVITVYHSLEHFLKSHVWSPSNLIICLLNLYTLISSGPMHNPCLEVSRTHSTEDMLIAAPQSIHAPVLSLLTTHCSAGRSEYQSSVQ